MAFASRERATDLPLRVDGCRIVARQDGNYVCYVHYRHWPIGSGICPGRRRAAFVHPRLGVASLAEQWEPEVTPEPEPPPEPEDA